MLSHFFPPSLFLLVGHYGSVHVQGKNYPTHSTLSHMCTSLWVCVHEFARTHVHMCASVCVSNMKGAHAAKVQSPVHVLKCSPRDGQHYPCLLHQQGPGARAGSWPFVSKQMEMGRGEVENWKEEEEE